MRINHNLASLNTYRQLTANNANGAKSLEKLSSGLRINRAGDDAAGLAISEKMRGQIRGLDQASRNSQDGISLIQTAEGALNETHSILQRMRELSVQSSNDTSTDADRSSIQTEISQLKSEIDRISSTTEFNTKKLLDGSITNAQTAQETKLDSLTLKAFARNLGGAASFACTGCSFATGTTFTINGVSVSLTVTQCTVTGLANDIVTSINNTAGIGVTATYGGATCAINLVAKTAGTSISVSSACTLAIQCAFGGAAAALSVTTSSAVSSTTQLRDLADANGNSLGLAANDCINASVMVGGTTAQTGAYVIADCATTLTTWLTDLDGDVAGIATAPAITSEGKLEFSGCAGLTNALSSLEFTVSGKSNFNNTFSAFSEVQAAEDVKSDSSLSFHIGANEAQTMSVGVKEISVRTLSLTGVDVSTKAGAEVGITAIDNAIKTVSSERSKLGAYQNRLEHTIANLGTSSENLTAAESRIRDVDMAKEMMEFTKNNILTQAAQAMLAQANQAPQGVLQLLR